MNGNNGAKEAAAAKAQPGKAKKEARAGPNPMKGIRISKLVISIGTGSDDQRHASARILLESMTGRTPADSISRHRLPEFKISQGQKIGTFVTLRGGAAADMLKRLFAAVDNKLTKKQVVDNAINFGIKEYIDISGVKYNPKVGMLGMNVNVALQRRGTRVEERKRARSIEGKGQRKIGREEIIDYIKDNFKVSVE
jgi:large subunit ribosomal protein L5